MPAEERSGGTIADPAMLDVHRHADAAHFAAILPHRHRHVRGRGGRLALHGDVGRALPVLAGHRGINIAACRVEFLELAIAALTAAHHLLEAALRILWRDAIFGRGAGAVCEHAPHHVDLRLRSARYVDIHEFDFRAILPRFGPGNLPPGGNQLVIAQRFARSRGGVAANSRIGLRLVRRAAGGKDERQAGSQRHRAAPRLRVRLGHGVRLPVLSARAVLRMSNSIASDCHRSIAARPAAPI